PANRFEGAIGLITSYDAEFAGAGRHSWGVRPAGFLRWGRVTLSGGGGFKTRHDDDVERGLSANFVQRRDWHVSVALRFDNGRQESDSDALDGLGDVKRTLRGRLRAQYQPDDAWRLHSSVSFDLLNRGGGWWADAGVSRRWHLGPDRQFQLGSSLVWAGARYLQSWYGVTEAQSATSGYAVYTPHTGLRNISVDATLRSELGPHWAGFVSAGLSRQLGPVAASPLVTRRADWSIGSGLVWRF
ncbi:MAG: MipA/OmpV family protein, partial [Rubrivivax sp.]